MCRPPHLPIISSDLTPVQQMERHVMVQNFLRYVANLEENALRMRQEAARAVVRTPIHRADGNPRVAPRRSPRLANRASQSGVSTIARPQVELVGQSARTRPTIKRQRTANSRETAQPKKTKRVPGTSDKKLSEESEPEQSGSGSGTAPTTGRKTRNSNKK